MVSLKIWKCENFEFFNLFTHFFPLIFVAVSSSCLMKAVEWICNWTSDSFLFFLFKYRTLLLKYIQARKLKRLVQFLFILGSCFFVLTHGTSVFKIVLLLKKVLKLFKMAWLISGLLGIVTCSNLQLKLPDNRYVLSYEIISV